MAVSVEPTTAKPVAHLQGKDPAAAILKNRFGEGEAYLFTTSDGAFRIDHPFWTGLARLAAGEPTLAVSAEDQRRYRIIMTRIADAYVLHVIDSQTDSPGNPSRQVTVSLLSARLDDPTNATQIGTDEPLTLSRDGGRISFVVQPDPVATVILE